MSDIKFRFAAHRQLEHDPSTMLNYIELNANQLSKESNLLDVERMQKLFFTEHEDFTEKDEADRLAVCELHNTMHTKIENSHNKLMSSPSNVESWKKRNRQWMGNQMVPYDNYHETIAKKHRAKMQNNIHQKVIETPAINLTHEDPHEERIHSLKGKRKLFFTNAPDDFIVQ